jgi:hypothetical protein
VTTKFATEPPDLPAGGHEEDTMAITERDRIRQSSRRHRARSLNTRVIRVAPVFSRNTLGSC